MASEPSGVSDRARETAMVTPFRLPVLGYTYDSGLRSIRLIQGMPGAAIVAEPVLLPSALLQATIAPGQDYAFVRTEGSAALRLALLVGSRGTLRSIPGLYPELHTVIFSAGGNSAVAMASEGGLFQVLEGLPHRPHILATVEDVQALPLAVSEDGNVLLTADGQGEPTILRVRELKGSSQFLCNLQQLGPVSFLTNTLDAVVADKSHQSVLLFHDVLGKAAVRILAGPLDGIANPVAVASSPDNRKVFVADAASNSVSVIDLASGLASQLFCETTPTSLHRLGDGALFSLTEGAARPLWLVDARGKIPAVTFIPVAAIELSDPHSALQASRRQAWESLQRWKR